ncbi:MAG: phosphotransferase family protein, partial [Actinobacteria bacterium]
MTPIDIAPDDIVRTREEGEANEREPLLVLEPLKDFLDEHGLGSGELHVEPVGDGHSNVTYAIRRDDGSEVIVRRPPRGPLPPSAHDVLREARVLGAVHGEARVPRVLAVSEGDVIGCPFYVMERVEGHVITTALPPELDTVADRRRMGEELVDALVEVHAIDWQAAGLEGFGKPTGYLERQLKRFLGLWDHNKTREMQAVETV